MLRTYTVSPSLRCHALNALLKLTSKQTPCTPKTEAHCRAYIQQMQEKNTAPCPSPYPLVKQPVEEDSACGMQTFTWNRLRLPNQKVLLYLHGGAYMNPPTSLHFQMVNELAQGSHAMAVFPVYPKIPAHSWADAFPMLLNLYDSLCAQHGAEQITLMGDSSGGGMALGFAYYLRDLGRPQPRRLMLICPWLDLHTQPEHLEAYQKRDPALSPWRLRIMGEMWAGGPDNMSHPYVSPIFGDPTGVAPITLLTGTREVLYPDAIRFHQTLDQRRIPHSTYVFNGMPHVFPAFPIPEAKVARHLLIHLLNES